jgi:hypothetical protein
MGNVNYSCPGTLTSDFYSGLNETVVNRLFAYLVRQKSLDIQNLPEYHIEFIQFDEASPPVVRFLKGNRWEGSTRIRVKLKPGRLDLLKLLTRDKIWDLKLTFLGTISIAKHSLELDVHIDRIQVEEGGKRMESFLPALTDLFQQIFFGVINSILLGLRNGERAEIESFQGKIPTPVTNHIRSLEVHTGNQQMTICGSLR